MTKRVKSSLTSLKDKSEGKTKSRGIMGKRPGCGLVHVGGVSWEEYDRKEKARDERRGQDKRPT